MYKVELARQHYKVACTRNDQLHKVTTYLTENYRSIVIEDLDVSEMLKNKRLSRSIADVDWYEFRRQLAYKANLRSNKIFIASQWYASSKKCSGCESVKKELSLSDRTYVCEHCKLSIDRD